MAVLADPKPAAGMLVRMKVAFAKSRQPPKPRVRRTPGRAPAPPSPSARPAWLTRRAASAGIMILVGAGLLAYWLLAPVAAGQGQGVFMLAVVMFAVGFNVLFPRTGRSRSTGTSSGDSSGDGWSGDSSWGSSDSGGGDSGGGGGGDGGGD